MTTKLDIKIKWTAIVGLCVIAFLIAGSINAIGAGVTVGNSASSGQGKSPAQSYCVQTGYMFSQQPSLNNGKPVCKFNDRAWCDAEEYYTGKCAASHNPFGLPNPYAADGNGASVHTPYGDVPLDVAYQYGGGGNINLKGGSYSGGYGGPEGISDNAAWTYGAMSFLNAP